MDAQATKRLKAKERQARSRARRSREETEDAKAKDRERKSRPEEQKARKLREGTEEFKAKERERKSRPEAKQARQLRDGTEEARAKEREQKSRPEAKQARKLRDGTEEARAKEREQKARPEAKEARRIREDRSTMSPHKLDNLRRSERLRKAQEREDMAVDKAAVEREEARVRMETHRIVTKTKVSIRDGLQSIETLNGTFPVSRLEDSADAIGKMDKECSNCGAFKFKRETDGFCCSSGKVLPNPFPRPPEDLQKLWTSNGRDGNLLKKYSRDINNAVALSSIQVSEKRFQNFNPSVIFQGQVKHRTGPLLPAEGETPRFSQLYCLDSRLESSQRFENMVLPANTPKRDKNDLKVLLDTVQRNIHKYNPFVQDVLMILEIPDEELENGKIVISASEKPVDEHARRYNRPTNLQEVSIVTNEARHDLVLHKRGGGLQFISDLNPKGMPFHFTLLFPLGTSGWNPKELHSIGRRRITTREFYCFHLQIRDNANQNYLHRAQRLFQEFVCMSWVTIEGQRLNYQAQNQKALRADCYRSVQEASRQRFEESRPRADQVYQDDHQLSPQIGRKVLAGSFGGGKRWLNGKYQDGMAIVREHRKPDLFITMTCNPAWPEIVDNLLDGQSSQDRPDLVARSFKMRKDQMMKDLINGQLLGKVVAHMGMIEFQKRGLPHLHTLLILDDHDQLITPEFVDNVISAELPPDPDDAEDEEQKKARTLLQDIVLKSMIHGPCGEHNPKSPCMENGKCTKGFPKPFVKKTIVDPDKSYATYQRRSPSDGGRTLKHDGKEIDNRWIIPYNPFLSLRYECHINVECCASTKSVKYLCKYINKGNDRLNVNTRVEGQPRDEIQDYIDMRYVGSCEAAWHIFSFAIHDRFPPVMALRVHLEEQQQIFFDENTELEALENQRDTELTAFFDFNKKATEEGRIPEELPKYVAMPKDHVYDRKKKVWRPRKKKEIVIGRVHDVSPVVGETYFLRMLLHDDHCRGKVSYEDMLAMPSGRICETFKEVCCELGLLDDDQEWNRILEEAAATKMCREIRAMFVIILMFCMPSEPVALFNAFWETWVDDFIHQAGRRGYQLTDQQSKTMLLQDLEVRLDSYEKTLQDFGLPTPSLEDLTEVDCLSWNQPAVIREELDFNFEEAQAEVEGKLPTFTDEQRNVFDTIMDAVRKQEPFQAFISARGGCGKTYVLNMLLDAVRTLEPDGCVALAMATTGIAANLLKLGRTFHSRMKAPLTATETSTLNISAQSHLAKLVRMSRLFLIDEGTMLNKYLLEAMDRTLRDLMQKPDVPFGGKVIVIAGDFKQCLPVIPGATRAGIIKHVISQSYLWSGFRILSLSTNMRVHASGNKDLEAFDQWTVDIGNGKTEAVKVPGNMVLTKITPNSKENSLSEGLAMEEFCRKIFPNLPDNMSDRNWINGRAILAPTNKEVAILNNTVCEMLPGNLQVFRSADSLTNPADEHRFTTEFLNSRNPTGFPHHTLQLKSGMPVMLLRNLDPKVQRSRSNKVSSC